MLLRYIKRSSDDERSFPSLSSESDHDDDDDYACLPL